jgi:putative ABC transport system permease protein
VSLLHELRLAVRTIVRSPAYAMPILLTFALTIGATSAIFSAVYGMLLKPLPIRDPARLVVAWETDPAHQLPVVELTYRQYERLAAGSRTFASLATMGSTTWHGVLRDRGEPVKLVMAGVSVNFFDTLGAGPLLGRTFAPGDDLPKAERVIVLSHALWRSRFGADPAIVGARVNLDDQLHTIVGVMPAGLEFPRGVEYWTPVVPVLASSGDTWQTDALNAVGVLYLVGRLGGTNTPGMAAGDLSGVSTSLLSSPAAPSLPVVLTPFNDFWFGPIRMALWVLLGAVGLFLLVGCANVSGLILARMSWRAADQAIHLALGATRARIALRWLVEVSCLSLGGGAIGLGGSFLLVRGIVALAPDDVPRLGDVAVNGPVSAVACVAIACAALLSIAGPARHLASWKSGLTFVAAGRMTSGRDARRIRSGLVIAQIALAVVLLVGAGLMVRTFGNLQRLDLGFDPAHVVTMNLTPDRSRQSANAWFEELIGRVRSLPGVEAAGAVYLRPLLLGPVGQETWVLLEGQPDTAASRDRNPGLSYQVATRDYFSTLRIRLLRGRFFDATDRPESPRVAIVSEGTARRLWPGQDPIGKRLLIPTFIPGNRDRIWRTVVGVVSDVRYRGLDDVRLDVYDVALQAGTPATNLVVRTSGDPAAMMSLVRAEVRRLDPHSLIDGVTTLDAVVGRAMAPWRFSVWILTVFAGVAFALAAVGLFGALSLEVANRRREFAVRLALGARSRDIANDVLLTSAVRVAAGTLVGGALAIAGSRAIASLLIGVSPVDARTYAAVIGIVVVVVAIASYVPARRAALTDPLPLLRGE